MLGIVRNITADTVLAQLNGPAVACQTKSIAILGRSSNWRMRFIIMWTWSLNKRDGMSGSPHKQNKIYSHHTLTFIITMTIYCYICIYIYILLSLNYLLLYNTILRILTSNFPFRCFLRFQPRNKGSRECRPPAMPSGRWTPRIQVQWPPPGKTTPAQHCHWKWQSHLESFGFIWIMF